MKWLVFLAVLVQTAVAFGGTDGIVLESYSGARPDDAGKTLAPLLAELVQHGYATGSDVATRFEGRASRAAGTAQDLPVGFEGQVDRGTKAWASGKFEDAVSVLGPLVSAAHEATGAFVGNGKLRDSLQRALIVLALSQQRLGDPSAASSTWSELIRSFPDMTFPKGTYGQEAATQFDAAKRAAALAPKGRLLIKVADEQTDVYINERLERRGTTAKDVPAGEYRIVVQLGSQRSRNHRVTIKAGEDVTVTIDPTFDATVRTAGWTGFQFATATERERSEAAFAAQFAQAIDGKALVVIGVDTIRGTRAVVGSIVLLNGKEIRRASLALEPAPSADRIAALASFLAGEQVSSTGIDVALDNAPAKGAPSGGGGSGPAIVGPSGPQHDDGGGKARWGGWPIITGVLALGALGAGGYLLAQDGKCKDGSNDPNCPDVYENKPPGFGAVAGGAVLAGITVYLIVTRPAKRPAKTVMLAPTDGGAMAAVWGSW